MRRQKTGRRAHDDERRLASELAAMYRKAQANPDGRYCVNPESDPTERVFIDFRNPEYLLMVLEGFAEHGTFVNVESKSADRLVLMMDFKKRTQQGLTRAEAIGQLADERHVDARTVERWMATASDSDKS